MMAGPGIAPNSDMAQVTSFADITPTILSLAGYDPFSKDKTRGGYSQVRLV